MPCPGSNAKPASCGELRPPPIKPEGPFDKLSVGAVWGSEELAVELEVPLPRLPALDEAAPVDGVESVEPS